ncbi:MAG: hypothetical protein LBK63_02390, partial [Treponema sp.]|nr:hypothetical protein [Treponema sp.]
MFITVFMLLLISCERKLDEKAAVSPSTIESEAGMNPQLNEFVLQVKEKMKEADAASGQKALELQTTLSAYIAEQTQNLMNQGISIMEIQGALQAAADRVEQTYAPDEDEFDEEMGERLDWPINVFTFFLPIEEAVITGFADGNIDKSELMDHIRIDSASFEMTEGLDLVLSDFGKNQALYNVISSGEIVAEGNSGEAFIPEYLTIKEADGDQYAVSDPAVFKSVAEVQSIAALLEPFDQKTFFKKADIKKLLKSGWLDGYDPRSVKKEADY